MGKTRGSGRTRGGGAGVGVERGGLRGWSWAWRTRRVAARGKQEGIEGDGDRAERGARVRKGLGGPWAISVEGEKARRPSRLD